MSRSVQTELRNPAVKFFQWSGDNGTINFYDKELKERVEVAAPFTFLVLDKLVTIAGYSDEDKSGFWSNEIRNTTTDVLTVKTKAGVRKQGLYNDVKTLTGAKFAQSVYIAFYDDNKVLQIGNFKFTGAAVSAWIEFCKGKNIYNGAITLAGPGEELTKGKTKYFAPVFEVKEKISEETEKKAIELDRQLQDYLTAYFAMRGADNGSNGNGDHAADNESYIDQRNREIAQYDEVPAFAPVTEGRGEEISDDSIPF